MDVSNLRARIQQTLQPLGLYSAEAEELLCATCAQESLMGKYRQQVHGPALGIFQMEPGDHDDIWTNFLGHKHPLAEYVASLALGHPPQPSELINNDPYAIAMCRVHYDRCPRALPAATDLNGLWMYYKVNYNSVHGAATQEQFNHNYATLVHGSAK